MERVYTLAEWDKLREARYEVARKIGFVQRSPVDQQIGKSKVKKAALKALYGEYGQPFRRPTQEN
ncbi:MAG: hypothetical protein HC904_11515 [Blastochloris sp.]|nr:hypothetical protein [Blastochloris sp.]